MKNMGYYINPRSGSKEEWLASHGVPLRAAPPTHVEGDSMAVCLIDNGMFTAAAVAYSQGELEAFANPDGRPKQWFWVKTDALVAVDAIPQSLIS